jgi:hypothetical protein
MTLYQDKSFNNQSVDVDGNRYASCEFNNCTLVYGGGALPQFDNCGFHNVSFQFQGAAFSTLKYLNGLYRGGLAEQVDTVLEKVEQDNPTLVERPVAVNSVHTGTNFGQLARLSAVFIVIAVLLIAAIWYGFLYYPQTVVLGAESPMPLSQQIPFSAMPSLPEELTTAYDQLHTDQLERLNSYGWTDRERGMVRIPIEDAFNSILQNGMPTWGTEGE